MTANQEKVAHFIRLIRGISPQYLRYACTHGGCHRFYLVLMDRFPSARPYRTVIDGGWHVVARIFGLYWDIYGEHDPKLHGAVKTLTAKQWAMFSSTHFEEGYVLNCPDVIDAYDKRMGKAGAS